MNKYVSAISRNADELSDELRKGEKALNVLLRGAKEVLQSLPSDEDDFASSERVCAAPAAPSR